MKSLHIIDVDSWNQSFSEEQKKNAVAALEDGKVLYFPALPFQMTENELQFLNPEKVDPKTKNISYDFRTDHLGGFLANNEEAVLLKNLLKRYAVTSRQFMSQLIPHYHSHLIQGKTSLRPVEIEGRKSSYRKDDTRLHVDSFPSNPCKGRRILRIFTNVNPQGKPRVWRLGEPFQDVVNNIAPRVSHPLIGFAYLLQMLKITKDYRTAYDHYMLQIHDIMKGDMNYQKTVPQEEIHFPPGSSWMVYTDQTSHAAMSGQHVFEQTFHVPVNGMHDPQTSPLKVLEKYFNKSLV